MTHFQYPPKSFEYRLGEIIARDGIQVTQDETDAIIRAHKDTVARAVRHTHGDVQSQMLHEAGVRAELLMEEWKIDQGAELERDLRHLLRGEPSESLEAVLARYPMLFVSKKKDGNS